jgi:hypothetical protein
MMTSEVDVPLSLLPVQRRSSHVAPKLKQRKRKAMAKLESGGRKMTFSMSESDPDAVLKGSDKFGSDIGLGRNETSSFEQRTGAMYCLVRMISDVPTFVGSDGQNYTVKMGDIAAIPSDQARVLYNRGIAVLMGDEA